MMEKFVRTYAPTVKINIVCGCNSINKMKNIDQTCRVEYSFVCVMFYFKTKKKFFLNSDKHRKKHQ